MIDPALKMVNPGSLAAVEQGCTCPVLENFSGMFPPLGADLWWIDVDCPLHGNGRAVDVNPPIEITG